MNQMLKAMPSPSGTNYEKLFLPDRGPSAAYDAAPDDETGVQMPARILEFLAGKLSGEDMSHLKSLLQGSAEDEDAETEEERQERLAKRGNEWDGAYSFASDSLVRGDARMTGGCGLEARPVGGRHINTKRAEAELRKIMGER
jgi:hypothetical protein